jgi:hypothetical protein
MRQTTVQWEQLIGVFEIDGADCVFDCLATVVLKPSRRVGFGLIDCGSNVARRILAVIAAQ